MTLSPAARRHRGKRHADYVPWDAWLALDKLSKADLMELLWDTALILTDTGGSAEPEQVLDIIRQSADALRANGYQGSVRLPESLTIS
jgi:hypothetical protein